MGLYGGMKANDIHKVKGLKPSEKILDHIGSTELVSNLFKINQINAIEPTLENLMERVKYDVVREKVSEKLEQICN
jgi:hypothetical protein